MIKNRETLISQGNIAGRKAALDILEAGLRAPDPYENTKKIIRLEKDKLIIGNPEFSMPLGQKPVEFDLNKVKHIYVVGGGKAAQKEAKALEDVLGDRITDSQINAKKGDPLLCKKVKVTFAGHPIPDEDSAAGARRMLEIEQNATEDDIVLFCTSGGGTALKALPAPGITLKDLQEVYKILYFGCGCSMPEANAVRNLLTLVRSKHPKNVKKAVLVEITTPEQIPTLRIHTFQTPAYNEAYERAIGVLRYYQIWDRVPESVRAFLLRKDPKYLPPSPQELKQRPYYRFRVMGPEVMLEAARRKAREMGINVTILASSLNDIEAKAVGEALGSIAEEMEVNGEPLKPPCALLLGGETPVAIGNETGLGGRNQELVLSAVPRIAGSKNIVIASADSDGTDGPGNFAGGIVDGFSMERIKAAGFDLAEELCHHNSTPVLQALGDNIYTGNTGTNVRDLRVVYVGGKA